MTERYENNRYLEGYALALALCAAGLALLGGLLVGEYYACALFAALSVVIAIAAMFVGGKICVLSSLAAAVLFIALCAFQVVRLTWYEAAGMVALSGMCMYLAYGARQHVLALREAFMFEHNRYVNAVMIDPLTELKTKRAYQSDASIYLRLARRNKLQVALLVWKMEDENKMRELLGDARYNELLRRISSVMRAQIRYEDISFMLESEPRLWGALMVTRKEFISSIASRQRHALGEIRLVGLPENWADGMRVGAGVYEGGDDISPLTLYDGALKSLTTGVLPDAELAQADA